MGHDMSIIKKPCFVTFKLTTNAGIYDLLRASRMNRKRRMTK